MTQAVPRTPARTTRTDPSARGAIVYACVAMAIIVGIDLVDGHIELLYSIGFILIVLTAPMAVHPRGLFPTGVLPPLLLVVSLFAVCLFAPDAIRVSGMAADAGTLARLIASTLDHGLTLVVGQALAMAAIGLRVLGNRAH